MHFHLRIVSYLSLAMLSGAALAAPGDPTGSTPTGERQDPLAAEPEARQPGQRTYEDQQGGDEQVRLIDTDELLGRDVVTQEGERIGTLAFLTVSLEEGNISHLVVDTSGGELDPGASGHEPSSTDPGASGQEPSSPDPAATAPSTSSAQAGAAQSSPGAEQSDGELLIVPWSVVDLTSRSDQVTLAATGHHIANAPRLKRQELNRLTEPELAAYVIDYWAPVSELAALEGRQQEDETQTRSTQPQQPGAQPSPEQEPREMRDPHRAEEQDRRLDQSATSGQELLREGTPGPSATAGATPSQSTAAVEPQPSAAEEGDQVVLVGQELVTAVTPPMFQLSQDLKGAQVTDRSGTAVGEIRRIMIDVDTGDAAFAVLEATPAGRSAVPLEALEWTAKGSTMLTADVSTLQDDTALVNDAREVSHDELAQLYTRFDVEPYWERSSRTDTSTQPMPQDQLRELP